MQRSEKKFSFFEFFMIQLGIRLCRPLRAVHRRTCSHRLNRYLAILILKIAKKISACFAPKSR